jgi:hypothetical protein
MSFSLFSPLTFYNRPMLLAAVDCCRYRALAEECSADAAVARGSSLASALAEEGSAANANLYLLLRACDRCVVGVCLPLSGGGRFCDYACQRDSCMSGTPGEEKRYRHVRQEVKVYGTDNQQRRTDASAPAWVMLGCGAVDFLVTACLMACCSPPAACAVTMCNTWALASWRAQQHFADGICDLLQMPCCCRCCCRFAHTHGRYPGVHDNTWQTAS